MLALGSLLRRHLCKESDVTVADDQSAVVVVKSESLQLSRCSSPGCASGVECVGRRVLKNQSPSF